MGLSAASGLIGWERVVHCSYDAPELERLMTPRQRDGIDVVALGPGNDLLMQRVVQAAASDAGLVVVGTSSSVGTRWRVHVDGTATAVVQPIGVAVTAAQPLAHDAVVGAVGYGAAPAGVQPRRY